MNPNEEPKEPDVKVRAKEDTIVDGLRWAKGQEGFLTAVQYNAVSRFFRRLN